MRRGSAPSTSSRQHPTSGRESTGSPASRAAPAPRRGQLRAAVEGAAHAHEVQRFAERVGRRPGIGDSHVRSMTVGLTASSNPGRSSMNQEIMVIDSPERGGFWTHWHPTSQRRTKMITVMGATGNVGRQIATRAAATRAIGSCARPLGGQARRARRAGARRSPATRPTRVPHRGVQRRGAVFTLLPYDPFLLDYHAPQNRLGEAIADAVRASGVPPRRRPQQPRRRARDRNRIHRQPARSGAATAPVEATACSRCGPARSSRTSTRRWS